jgi:CTP:molybdopterin cytidylyltransferase MocA
MTAADFPTVSADEDVADDVVERLIAAAGRVGRPSLTAPGTHSPMLNLRISQAMKADLERVAAIKGIRQSDVVREALDKWLNAELSA